MAFRFSKAILGSLIFFLMVVSAFAKNRADELNRLNDDEFRQPVDKVYLVQTTVGALPAKVFAMDPRIKKARARTNYIITVGMVNDNITPSNMPGDGDDRGLTFGYFVKINRLTSNGMMLTVSYSEDLYTKDTSRTVKKIIAITVNNSLKLNLFWNFCWITPIKVVLSFTLSAWAGRGWIHRERRRLRAFNKNGIN